MDQMITYPTKPSTLLNSIFMYTVNTAAKTLMSIASTSTSSSGDAVKWKFSDHLSYMFMLMTWVTVWFLRVLMDYLPSSLVPSPHYFLSGGGLLALGSSDFSSSSTSTSTSTSTDLVVHDGFAYHQFGGPSTKAMGRALSHIFGLVNDTPASSRKYQFAISVADNTVDENTRDGHIALQEINRIALSSAFARTSNLLYQSLQRGSDIDETNTWPMRMLSLLPLGSYLGWGLQFCLHNFLPLLGSNNTSKQRGMIGSGEVTRSSYESVKAEKYAHELLWITNKLRGCGVADEALVQWSVASGLATASLMASQRVQNTIVLISAILVRELARGETKVPKQVKYRLLLLWVPLFCYASNGLAHPVLTAYEKAEMEKAMEEIISCLPVSDQEIILTNWLQDFVCSNSEWPNLRVSYDRWCRCSRKLLM
ncbi:hypothetical protein IFM89_020772 [Coptis chinensis]|uniref:At3g05675-like ankyrin-like domain-containing protein n=1 Tax=Coptis chinensis TaxID=261450 RepID=A0A835HYW5_9MAGN|nr:hypothetical protein IFM89_020772 [Coptis chinensis]